MFKIINRCEYITYYISGLYSTFVAFIVFTGILVLIANIAVSFGKCDIVKKILQYFFSIPNSIGIFI